VFVCMLAAYLLAHTQDVGAAVLRRRGDPSALRPGRSRDPLQAGEEQRRHQGRLTRRDAARPVHPLNHLATLTRNTVVFASGVRIDKLALPTALQRRAFELIGVPIPTRIGPL